MSTDQGADALTEIRSALLSNRELGLRRLNDMFRKGDAPEELTGRLHGELVALELAPGLTDLLTRLTSNWLPWKGKTFDYLHARGDNMFSRDSLRIARVFSPFYNDFVGDGPQNYRAFAFRTYLGPGREDPDRIVMKIDYDLPENPGLIRRVLDELVRVGEGTYLGKAHVKWWWGPWQRVAYFALTAQAETD
jgi:hypothetical protein